ncbi:hypothetical protein [Synechococcus sp. R5-13]|jgi:hypothetical protein|uniref:hypothetical protein n=1 Tax=unclassified Synechococcus TaxID=2626047 RepID=UPI0039C0E391
MSERETVLWMWVQGLGLNLSGLALLAAAGAAFGPLSWTGATVAVMLKLIGDSQLVRGYWLWQSQRQQKGSQPVSSAAAVLQSQA